MLVYMNGNVVPEEEAHISIRDRGFTIGEGVFEGWRTYGGRTVSAIMAKHLLRLERSLRFIEIEPEPVIESLDPLWLDVVERNHDAILEVGDVWIHTIVTGGVGAEGFGASKPTVVVAPTIIPFQKLFQRDLYTEGAHLVPSLTPSNPFTPVDPRVKSISRLGNARAERKQTREGSGTWTVTFDDDGTLTEATVAGVGVVQDGALIVVPRWKRLESVSLQVATELAVALGIPVVEQPLNVYDLLNADEVYIFGTSFAIVPVSDLDGIPLRNGRAVGDRIRDAWVEFVGFDFVEQSRRLAGAITA